MVQVVGPDPTWPEQFRLVREHLLGCLGAAAVSIEHIGSTSVPGLAAKPTIDVLVVVDDTDEVLARSGPLAALGFEYRPDAWPDPRRHLFLRRVVDGRRTHHLHVVPVGSPEIDDYLTLRDYLRTHPAEASAYRDHKHAARGRYRRRTRRLRRTQGGLRRRPAHPSAGLGAAADR